MYIYLVDAVDGKVGFNDFNVGSLSSPVFYYYRVNTIGHGLSNCTANKWSSRSSVVDHMLCVPKI